MRLKLIEFSQARCLHWRCLWCTCVCECACECARLHVCVRGESVGVCYGMDVGVVGERIV